MPNGCYRNNRKWRIIINYSIDELFDSKLLDQLGVLEFGYTEDPLAASYSHFKNWVESGHHHQLSYLEGDKMRQRESLKNYYPDFESALVFLFDYRGERKGAEEFFQSSESNGHRIGAYTLIDGGRDYHFSIRAKLEQLALVLQQSIKDLDILYSLDTQPILERDLACKAGLGWFGKNSMLINKNVGSFFLIGSLLLNKKLNSPIKIIDSDHCGTCLACVEACPTNAINPHTRSVEVESCIPYFTIELFKDSEKPPREYGEMDEIFGCDICQDVCPWNKKTMTDVQSIGVPEQIKENFLTKKKDEMILNIESMSKKGFKRMFKGTSFERTGRDGLIKNLKYKK